MGAEGPQPHGGAEAIPRSVTLTCWNLFNHVWPSRIQKELAGGLAASSHIISLQELSGLKPGYAGFLAEMLGMNVHQVWRDAILTRLPIENAGEIKINPATGRLAAWADLALPWGGLLRVYSIHLTYQLRPVGFLIPEVRAAEMRAVIEHAAAFPGPVVISGDLNSIGYLLFGQRREPSIQVAKDAGYVDCLEGQRGGTHMSLGRLDWIFARGLAPLKGVRGRFGGSDHRWLQATLGDPNS